MRLKHDIGDTVYYFSANHEAWLKGIITAVHTNTSDIDEFIMYTIKNLYPVDKEDEGGFVFDDINVCATAEEVYGRLKKDVYINHSDAQIRHMDKEEFNKLFADKHGRWEIPDAMIKVINHHFKGIDMRTAEEIHSQQTRDPLVKEYT